MVDFVALEVLEVGWQRRRVVAVCWAVWDGTACQRAAYDRLGGVLALNVLGGQL